MSKAFIGKGFQFPILPGPTGALAWSDGDANVEQSLHVLLLTRLGERVMRGDFGTKLGDLVFRPGSDQNLRAIEREVSNAIVAFEPRAEVLDVTAEADAVDATQITVAVVSRTPHEHPREPGVSVLPRPG